MPRGVHASVVRKPKARLVQRLHLLSRFMRPPHTAKRGFSSSPSDRSRPSHARRARAHRPHSASASAPPPSVRHARHRRRRRGARAGARRGSTSSRPTRSSRTCTSGATGPRRDAIGHKALAVNLSDLAAMGATPRASLLSLALPADAAARRLRRADRRLRGAGRTRRARALVGGNLTRSPGPLVVDVTAIGAVRRRRVLRRRHGARRATSCT